MNVSQSLAFEQSLLKFKEQLTRNLLLGFVCVCMFALPISLLRWFTIGYQFVFVHHVVITLIVCACYFIKYQRGYKVNLFIIVTLLTSMVISGTMAFGLQTGTAAFSAFCALIVAIGWGSRAAIAYAICWFIFFSTIGYLFVNGYIQYSISPNAYASTFGAWAIVAVGTSMVSIFTLISARQCYRYFSELISEIEQQKQDIERLANIDSLTGYSCHRLSMPHLEHAISLADRDHTKVAVVFIDLDNFKQINDQHGHSVGDRVLTEVTARMRSVLREIDIPCRVGGDEFLFILPSIHSKQELSPILERIEGVWRNAIDIGSTTLTVSGSIGIALYPDDGSSADELRTKSDLAMYQSKNNTEK
ncbi:diguanylate cyclase domain-containing protein [Glaciecola sp. SC05]|uniref:diguanylate cyclase domain-containing protein n=1 Tax=Glaciecola sp. SC05 TaxID=1987355 RepID=UPI0035280594